MMQCRDIDELMLDYLYQELDGEQAETFRTHLDGCARCGAELRGLQQMRQALRSLPEAEPSSAVTSRLLHEAGKRARSSEDRGGVLAWFQKLLTPIVAHPAWATAGSLVLVAGIAAVLQTRGKVSERAQPVEMHGSESAAAGAEPKMPAANPEPAPAPDTAPTTPPAAAQPPPPADLRSASKPEPPAEYSRKVVPPAITAKPKAMKRAESKDLDSLDDGLDRGGRITSAAENEQLLKAGDGKNDASKLSLEKAKEKPAEPATRDGEYYQATGAREHDRADKPADEIAQEEAKPIVKQQPMPAPAKPTSSTAAGSAAASPPPPPAAEPPSQSPTQAENVKLAAKEGPKEPPEATMFRQVQKSASTGNCNEALSLSSRISKMNPEFWRKRVAGDPSLRSCQVANESQQQRKKAPARAPTKTEDAYEAPAVDKAAH